jgi:hypothetical protein
MSTKREIEWRTDYTTINPQTGTPVYPVIVGVSIRAEAFLVCGNRAQLILSRRIAQSTVVATADIGWAGLAPDLGRQKCESFVAA